MIRFVAISAVSILIAFCVGFGLPTQSHPSSSQGAAALIPPQIHASARIEPLAAALMEAEFSTVTTNVVEQPGPENLSVQRPSSEMREYDAARSFRSALRAIEHTTVGPVLIVQNGTGAVRRLRVGDAFERGWRIQAISDQRVTLRNGRRIVGLATLAPLHDAPPMAPIVQATTETNPTGDRLLLRRPSSRQSE